VNGLEIWAPIAAAADVHIPDSHKLPIAIIGAGAIVDGAHLPAYAKEQLEIVGIYDVDGARAAEVAERHGIPRVYSHQAELLEDEAVRVVDVAVPAAHQPAIVRAAIAAGKDMLGQLLRHGYLLGAGRAGQSRGHQDRCQPADAL